MLRKLLMGIVVTSLLLAGGTGVAAADTDVLVCGSHGGNQTAAGATVDSDEQTGDVITPDQEQTRAGLESLVGAIADGDSDTGNGRLHAGVNQDGDEQVGAGSDEAFEEDVKCTEDGPEQRESDS